MPYIKPEDRVKFLELISLNKKIENVGELNFVISMLCHNFLDKKGESYENYNSIVGVLECAKQEYYRMAVAPYEEIKKINNGNIGHQKCENCTCHKDESHE